MSWAAYVFLLMAALTTAYLLWSSLSVRNIKGQSVDVLFSALPELESHQDKAVIYCYSQHCGPCKQMAADVERLRSRHPNLFKLDVGMHPTEARQLGIQATPTSLLVENGRVHKALLGSGAVKPMEIFLGKAAT